MRPARRGHAFLCLDAVESVYPLAEFDPLGLGSITEVHLGLEIPNRDGAAHADVGLWAITVPCWVCISSALHCSGQDFSLALLIQCPHT